MRADPTHPGRGSFVRDQVAALRELEGVDVELFEFPPGVRELAGAAREGRRRGRFDVVHAHYGLTAWPALAVRARLRALTVHGSDLRIARTRHATAVVLPAIGLLAATSAELAAQLPTSRARARARILPCGVDTGRFAPLERRAARERIGLAVDRPLLLFPADRSRPEKRFDLAERVALACGAELVALGATPPAELPLWINAANAVLVPSEREGFGLAVLEALACDVPVLATPVGEHAAALAGVEGCLCAPFDADRWAGVARVHLAAEDPRVAGRAAAERYSAKVMAGRVLGAWREALGSV